MATTKPTTNLSDRLLDSLNRSPSGCWEWTGRVMHKGYGVLSHRHRSVRAHRLAYELFCGPIPAGVMVCHRCDNRRCCNPVHLFLGTATVNNRDRDAKGRRGDVRGERHGQAKLTKDDVLEMRRRREAGETFVVIGAEFGVSAVHARRVVTGEKWGHV